MMSFDDIHNNNMNIQQFEYDQLLNDPYEYEYEYSYYDTDADTDTHNTDDSDHYHDECEFDDSTTCTCIDHCTDHSTCTNSSINTFFAVIGLVICSRTSDLASSRSKVEKPIYE
mmetsp:Transcript_13364/g.15575  ORF Transcript_13364/g.15575 Transcript_13364/m.15575 type:complete len:114 (-) Transcript_13364:366-707(-)